MTTALHLQFAIKRLATPAYLAPALHYRAASSTARISSTLTRGYATASVSGHSTAPGGKVGTPPANLPTTFASHAKDAASPTISHRPPSGTNDDKKLEDWVLYHPVYTEEEVKSVKVVRHEPVTFGDKLAARLVKFFRSGFDLVTGYKHSSPEAALEAAAKMGKTNLSLEEMRKEGLVMDTHQWLQRILFLESIAGVPGMVAGTLRHLRSLRLMKRDGGFIHQLLEEAENERMHLLTFIKLAQPSLFFRVIILGAQGVFYNLFFLSYLISPKTCHRFVGVLEEEAVYTYTMCIKEIEDGRLPEWENKPAPRIAIDYWRMKEDATLLDVIYAVRSDEAGHRFANHTFANVKDQDFNPMALRQPDGHIQGTLPGFSREEGLDWYQDTSKELFQAKERVQEKDAKQDHPPKVAA